MVHAPAFGPASIAISLALGLLCAARIRACDVHGRAPLVRLFLVALYGGLLAAGLSLIGYRLAHAAGFSGFREWYGFLLFVGPIEEGAKYLGLRASRLVYGRRPDEPAEGMVCMASVALGFSLVENFLYANAGAGNGHLLWLRLLLSTPAHILFSFPMGVTHAQSREDGYPKRAAAAFALACLAHGAYNILSESAFGLLLAPALLVLLWLGLLNALRYAHTTSPYRPSLGDWLASPPALLRPGPACGQCGNPRPMPRFADGALEVRRCGECGCFVVSRDNAFRLFRRFAPEFRRLEGELRPSPGREGYQALYGVIHLHGEAGSGWFHGDALEARLTDITARLRARLEDRPLVRLLFGPPRPPAGNRPPPVRAGARPRDLALAALGAAGCAAWGLFHLDSIRIVSLHPALSRSWEDSTLSVAYPRGWDLNVWTSGDGREVSLSLEAQGRAAMSIRSQAWEVVPREAADAALGEVLGGMGASERARRPLMSWGRFAGAGSELDMRSARGRDVGLSVFAHSADGRSFVALELVEADYREPLRPGMELVRRTLRLKPSRRPRGAPSPAGGTAAPAPTPLPGSAAGAPAPPAAASVTRMLRDLLLAAGEGDAVEPAP